MFSDSHKFIIKGSEVYINDTEFQLNSYAQKLCQNLKLDDIIRSENIFISNLNETVTNTSPNTITHKLKNYNTSNVENFDFIKPKKHKNKIKTYKRNTKKSLQVTNAIKQKSLELNDEYIYAYDGKNKKYSYVNISDEIWDDRSFDYSWDVEGNYSWDGYDSDDYDYDDYWNENYYSTCGNRTTYESYIYRI